MVEMPLTVRDETVDHGADGHLRLLVDAAEAGTRRTGA
jgi:hypothetical protein